MRRQMVRTARFFRYGFVPLLSYMSVAVVVFAARTNDARAIYGLAAVMLTILSVGIRNA